MGMLETFALFGVNPEAIADVGIWLIAFIVFAESGLLIGFFLPGDTLLVAAGVLASQGNLSITTTIVAIVLAAIIGDNVGYSIGQISGKRLFHKKDGILFRREYVERAQSFYEKHGGKTIILARFVPIVRTFAPMVAGIGKMPWPKFFAYNVVGALIWGVGVTLLGYWVGSKIPNIGEYLEYALLVVIVLSLAPAIWHIVRDEKSRTMIAQKFHRIVRRSKKHADTDENA